MSASNALRSLVIDSTGQSSLDHCLLASPRYSRCADCAFSYDLDTCISQRFLRRKVDACASSFVSCVDENICENIYTARCCEYLNTFTNSQNTFWLHTA